MQATFTPNQATKPDDMPQLLSNVHQLLRSTDGEFSLDDEIALCHYLLWRVRVQHENLLHDITDSEEETERIRNDIGLIHSAMTLVNEISWDD